MRHSIRPVTSSWESHTFRELPVFRTWISLTEFRVFVLLMQTVFFPLGLHKVST